MNKNVWDVDYRPFDGVANGLSGVSLDDKGFVRLIQNEDGLKDQCVIHNGKTAMQLNKEGVPAYKPEKPIGLKFDSGAEKLKWSLVPWLAMREVVKVLMRGETKYTQTLSDGTVISGADNWKLVQDWNRRYFDSSMRHNIDEWLGKDFDDESGIWELAHNICGDLFRLQMKLEETKEVKSSK